MSPALATRAEIERREHDWLAPQAAFSDTHWARPVEEAPDPFRTCFVRDRDRVLHCGAFRRLKDKTQVFVIDEGDFYRTRLTHTLEVCQLTRYLCRALRLNESLGEVLALVHDIGHPPFGHEGERILDQRSGTAFDHNRQALRIVDVLESPYADRPGLNLTQLVRRMILKHGGEAGRGTPPTTGHVLEAQVADLSDSTAYQHHDLEDALRAGILALGDLEGLSIWQEAGARFDGPPRDRQGVKAVLNHMLKTSLHDVLETTRRLIDARPDHLADDIAREGLRLVRFSDRRAEQHRELGRFLYERFYRNPRVLRSSDMAAQALGVIVEHYKAHPEELPAAYRARLDDAGISRSVCDYVAGMTDRFAMDVWRRLSSGRARGGPAASRPPAPGAAGVSTREGGSGGTAASRTTSPATDLPASGGEGNGGPLAPDLLERVLALEEILDHSFRDKSLAATALTHASARTDLRPPNERLEFLGDAVLGLVVGQELYARFPHHSEGELSRMKSVSVSRHALNTVAESWGLRELLVLGPGFPTPADAPPSLAADGVEAVLGALYLDGGLELVRELILSEFGQTLDASAEGRRSRNEKSELQAFTQGELGHTPHYQVLAEEGPDHKKEFTIAAVVGGVQVAVAQGRNKRQAEQRAAREALSRLRAALAGETPLPPGLGPVQRTSGRGPGEEDGAG